MKNSSPHFNIVLHTPEIPGNTGSIGRTCVALNINLILIRPLGFEIDEKSVRRAGLHYWQHLQLKVYDSWEDFIAKESPAESKLFFFSKSSQKSYYHAPYTQDCYLVFGAETKGLPTGFFQKYPESFYSMPMFSEKIKISLNLSNAATAVAYECLRHLL